MTTALTPRHPLHCYDGYLDCATRLHHFGITLTEGPVTGGNGRYDPDTATLCLREDAPVDIHLDTMIEVWKYIALGPHLSRARPAPQRLRLIR